MRKAVKAFMARHASGWRSTRHVEARLRFPTMDFHEALTRVTYKRVFGTWPDLESPRTLSEKLCWLKIHDRRPVNAVITDKFRMRAHVERLGLGHHLNELHAVWDSVDDIDFRNMPDAYALKVTNGSSWNIIKRPGEEIDETTVRRKLQRWMNTRMSDHKGEWYYDASPSRIIAERYLDADEGQTPDYKLFVFNRAVRFVQYYAGRFTKPRVIFMSPEWESMPFSYKAYGDFGPPPPKPDALTEMISASEILSEGFPLIRADFFIWRDQLLLGELTLNPVGGYTAFRPEQWNRTIGSWLELPDKAVVAA